MDKLTINGVTLYLDMLDADVVEQNEAALNAMTAEIEAITETNAEGMKKQCRVVERFIDAVFGPGNAEAIFRGRENHLGEHLDALGQVTTYMQENSKGQTNEILARYAPKNQPVVKLRAINGPAAPVEPTQREKANATMAINYGAEPDPKEEKAAKIAALLAEML